MASSATNAPAARAERPERTSDGGRRVTQSGPRRAAPEAALCVGAGGGGGDGFQAAARCSLSGGWRTGLGFDSGTSPPPPRRGKSGAGVAAAARDRRLLLPSERAVCGASQALSAPESRAPRASARREGAGPRARGPEADA